MFADFFMNELKNLTYGVIGKLGVARLQTKLFFNFINYNIIIVQVRYITIETKEVVHIGYNGFLFPHAIQQYMTLIVLYFPIEYILSHPRSTV